MYIENITLNGVTSVFNKEINIVPSMLFHAVKAVLLREKADTDILATVYINNQLYTVNINCGKVSVYKDGVLINAEYLNLLKTFPERKAFFDFSSKRGIDYSKRFMFYKDIDFYYPNGELRHYTFGICDTRSFRNYLNEFTSNLDFCDMRLNSKYCLVNCGKSDKEQFNFNCFLLLSEFWDGFNKIRDMHNISQPITTTVQNTQNLLCSNRQIFIEEI